MNRGFLLFTLLAFGIVFGATWYALGLDGASAQNGGGALGVTATASTAPANCEEAEAMGVAPLMAGRPGYSRDLDPDGDGIACPPRS
jgi:hypothetical protein